MTQHYPSRRDFLKATAATAGTLSVPTWWRPVQGKESANDRLAIGSIGTSVYVDQYPGEGDRPGAG